MARRNLLQIFRVTHLYFGVFVTPALLFFAFTGALQTFGLHETNRDHPNYKPAHWIAVLAQIHKKQTDVVPVRRPPAQTNAPASAAGPDSSARGDRPAAVAGADHQRHERDQQDGGQAGSGRGANAAPAATASAGGGASAAAATPARPSPNPLPMRIFFLVVSIGLLSSCVTGLYMSYQYTRNKRLVTLTLVAGIVLPLLLLLV